MLGILTHRRNSGCISGKVWLYSGVHSLKMELFFCRQVG